MYFQPKAFKPCRMSLNVDGLKNPGGKRREELIRQIFMTGLTTQSGSDNYTSFMSSKKIIVFDGSHYLKGLQSRTESEKRSNSRLYYYYFTSTIRISACMLVLDVGWCLLRELILKYRHFIFFSSHFSLFWRTICFIASFREKIFNKSSIGSSTGSIEGSVNISGFEGPFMMKCSPVKYSSFCLLYGLT